MIHKLELIIRSIRVVVACARTGTSIERHKEEEKRGKREAERAKILNRAFSRGPAVGSIRQLGTWQLLR